MVVLMEDTMGDDAVTGPAVQDWVRERHWPLITVHSRLLSCFFNKMLFANVPLRQGGSGLENIMVNLDLPIVKGYIHTTVF